MSKTVVVWGGEDIFSLSIETLLTSHTDWQVIRVFAWDKLEAYLRDGNISTPDIVILQRDYRKLRPNLPRQMLRKFPNTRIIMVCLETNLMEVFEKQEIFARDTLDLIRVIEMDHWPRQV